MYLNIRRSHEENIPKYLGVYTSDYGLGLPTLKRPCSQGVAARRILLCRLYGLGRFMVLDSGVRV